MARLQREPFDPAAETAAIVDAAGDAAGDGAGAIVSFVGLVRGGATRALVLERHPTATLAAMDGFEAAARTRWRLAATRVVHRFGELAPGEPIVFVAAAAAHRRAAFEAADMLMDALKTRAPFWKREIGADGADRWIEPTAADYADARRWSADLTGDVS
ncbi:MAG: molybdenum cofactor biosynthesis protein MoaE [Parvularculaceae bacterium]